MDLYREQLLDHYHRPQGWGLRDGATLEERGVNPLCGDDVTVQLFINGEVIETMRHQGHGCVISRAAASLLSSHIEGKRVTEVRTWNLATMNGLLGIAIPPARVSCALLALGAVQRALSIVPSTK